MCKVMRSKTFFMVCCLVLASVAFFLSILTVKGQSDGVNRELEAYYRTLENTMVADARAYLNECGYANSGVMLTHVSDAEGNREYTLTVHHGMIDELSVESKEMLRNDLAQFDFVSENCTFCHKFLSGN